jgi:hypothetical protein
MNYLRTKRKTEIRRLITKRKLHSGNLGIRVISLLNFKVKMTLRWSRVPLHH